MKKNSSTDNVFAEQAFSMTKPTGIVNLVLFWIQSAFNAAMSPSTQLRQPTSSPAQFAKRVTSAKEETVCRALR